MADTPRLFRVVLEVADLDAAATFYARLLGTDGRRIRGSRHYFDCGPIILALLDPSPGGEPARPSPNYTYFAVGDLEAVYARARALGCLESGTKHDSQAGEIVTRPWGERSFYVRDAWGNGLCFVDERTLFTGR
jgi:catechol 2,3-dioxygenase-like lactoylglutathione lyase family enzyme